jgi:type IV fimbrial biogenesis protein FimT
MTTINPKKVFKMERNSNKQSGFTLLELVVVVAIIALVSIIALPQLNTTRENYQLKSAAVDMLSYFQKAKMEAVKRGTNVVLSFSPGVNGSYEIFVDNGAGGGTADNWTRDGGEESIRQIRIGEGITMPAGDITFTGNTAGFNSRGMPIGNRIGTVNLVNNNSNSYSIVLSMAGSVRLQKD